MHLIDQELNLMLRGRYKEAWNIAEEIEKLMPNNPRGKFNRGWFLINQGKFQEGYQCLENGRNLNVYGSQFPETSKPLWHNQELKDKILLINLEAGYGDQIIHSRFATCVAERGGKPILACTPDLKSIFSRIPGCYKTIGYDEIKYTRFDYWLPGFSSGWVLGHTFDSLPNRPYLFPTEPYISKWKQQLNTEKKYRIGIRWSGNPKFEHQQFRMFPSESLINLYKEFPNIQFYSLQKNDDLKELPSEIIDLNNELETWEDTAACISQLDLVISSCTSTAHISSALGNKTWVVVPILPYHVWAYGDQHSPWYSNSTTIFRQTKFGCWNQPFELLYNQLKKDFI